MEWIRDWQGIETNESIDTYTVTYRVTGGAQWAYVTFLDAQGDLHQSPIHPPWSTSISVMKGGFVFLDVQNYIDKGPLNGEILINGTLWKKAQPEADSSLICSGHAGVDPSKPSR